MEKRFTHYSAYRIVLTDSKNYLNPPHLWRICYARVGPFYQTVPLALFSGLSRLQFLTICEVGKTWEQDSQNLPTWGWVGAVAVCGGVGWVTYPSQGQLNGATCMVHSHAYQEQVFITHKGSWLIHTAPSYAVAHRVRSYAQIHKKQLHCLPAATRMPIIFTQVCSCLEKEEISWPFVSALVGKCNSSQKRETYMERRGYFLHTCKDSQDCSPHWYNGLQEVSRGKMI